MDQEENENASDFVGPQGGGLEEILLPLRRIFASEPGVGVSLVTADGLIRFANERAVAMFGANASGEVVGRSLADLSGREWADERMRVFERIQASGRPMILRHIRKGVQLQSTITLLEQTMDGQRVFLVVTTVGEHDPLPGQEIEIIESDYVHLGDLGALTPRELEVLALVGHGLTAKEIGETLYRSPRTIEQHVYSMREKLEVASRVQLAEFARRAGLRLADATKKRV